MTTQVTYRTDKDANGWWYPVLIINGEEVEYTDLSVINRSDAEETGRLLSNQLPAYEQQEG